MRKFRIFLWKIFNRNKYKMYCFGLSQGFPEESSYYSTRYARKELVKSIINDKL